MSMRGLRPVRMTAMHHAQVALGATFKDDGDWRVADVYTSPPEEVGGALAAAGLADVSATGKLQVRGEAVEALLDKVGGIERLAAGMARRVRLNGAAALACRLTPEELLVLTNAADAVFVADLLRRAADSVGCAHCTDLTSALAAVDIVGPNAPRLLARVVPFDLAPLGASTLVIVQGELARVHAILTRLDRPPVPAYRALVGREHGAFVWEALLDAGRDLGLVPVGAAARAVLEDLPPCQ